MENSSEELPMVSANEHTYIMKGKRTKRPRLLAALTSSSSGGEDRPPPSPTSSTQIYESTEEEEDMANCLIMLAQSGGEKLIGSARRSSETTIKAGLYVYECKTCSRCFPSFQALGGHRASHKKPKATTEEKLMAMMMIEDGNSNGNNGGFSLLQQQQLVKSNNSKSRVHECSICGSEFSSGQALGGHMRRHRIIPENQEMKKPRNVLSLDLNLPAPEDDPDSYNKFQTGFTDDFSRKQPLVFTAAALVDCHY